MSEKDSHSIRTQQQSYQNQIRNTYSQHLDLFLTHSSDLLHLKTLPSLFQQQHYLALIATTNYNKYDTILEVRGSVITKNKLTQLLQDQRVHKEELPVLLRLNQEKGWLLSPKNIAKYLFLHPIAQGLYGELWAQSGNCFVENHYGAKLMVVAGRDIAEGQELILDRANCCNVVFRVELSDCD